MEAPFRVGIINPCESSLSLTAPDLPVVTMSPSEDFTFPEFTLDPAWCDIQYTYQVDTKEGFAMVENWDESLRTFRF